MYSIFEQTWIQHPGCFVTSMFEIGQVTLEKKLFMWKVYRQADRQIGGQQEDRKASTLQPLVQVI